MSETQKPFSKKGRENYDKIFCPYRHTLGGDYAMSGHCLHCALLYPDKHSICADNYRHSLPDGVIQKPFPKGGGNVL